MGFQKQDAALLNGRSAHEHWEMSVCILGQYLLISTVIACETKKKQNLTFINHNSSLAIFTALILLLTVLFTLWGDSMWQEKSVTSFNIWLFALFPQNQFAYLQISVFPTGIEGVKYCLSSRKLFRQRFFSIWEFWLDDLKSKTICCLHDLAFLQLDRTWVEKCKKKVNPNAN